MLRDEVERLQKAGTRELRHFGLLVGGVFVALGLVWFLRHKPFYWSAFVPGVPLLALGAIVPRALKWPYVAWMAMAMAIGAVISTVLLCLLFYLVLTPIGLVARLAGKDFLGRKLDRKAASYWILRDASKPKEKRAHELQF
jgi:hypothetical protein